MKTFKELSEEKKNMVRALMEDLHYHGDDIAGFTQRDVSKTMGVKESSLAALKANMTRQDTI